MNLTPLIKHLVDDIKIPRKRVAELMEIDPKTVTRILGRTFEVVEIPRNKTMRVGTSLQEECI